MLKIEEKEQKQFVPKKLEITLSKNGDIPPLPFENSKIHIKDAK